jgi:hypothetical protein
MPVVMVMVVAVIVIVIVIVIVAAGCGAALTGRLRRDSTAGLAVVAAAILSRAQLDEVVRQDHSQLRSERRIVRGPVREGGSKAGLWSGIRFGHAEEPTTMPGRLLRPPDRAGRAR